MWAKIITIKRTKDKLFLTYIYISLCQCESSSNWVSNHGNKIHTPVVLRLWLDDGGCEAPPEVRTLSPAGPESAVCVPRSHEASMTPHPCSGTCPGSAGRPAGVAWPWVDTCRPPGPDYCILHTEPYWPDAFAVSGHHRSHLLPETVRSARGAREACPPCDRFGWPPFPPCWKDPGGDGQGTSSLTSSLKSWGELVTQEHCLGVSHRFGFWCSDAIHLKTKSLKKIIDR